MDPNRPQTSSSKKKWFIGCGIGCGAIIVIVVLLILSGVMFVKNIVKGFEESEAILDTLTERYGEVEEYCPEPDGAIRPARIEVFLKVRELMRPIRNELESAFNLFSKKNKSEDFRKRKTGGWGYRKNPDRIWHGASSCRIFKGQKSVAS